MRSKIHKLDSSDFTGGGGQNNPLFYVRKNSVKTLLAHKYAYSWVSRDVIISLGVNSKSMHSHRTEIVFSLYVLTLCLAANMYNFVRFFHSSTA